MAMTMHLRTPDPPDSRKAGYAAHSVFAVELHSHRIAGLFRSRKKSINPKVYRSSTATGLHGNRNYIPMPLGSILKP